MDERILALIVITGLLLISVPGVARTAQILEEVADMNQVQSFPLTHGTSNVVTANLCDPIQMLLKIVQEKDMVGLAASQQRHRLTLILQ